MPEEFEITFETYLGLLGLSNEVKSIIEPSSNIALHLLSLVGALKLHFSKLNISCLCLIKEQLAITAKHTNTMNLKIRLGFILNYFRMNIFQKFYKNTYENLYHMDLWIYFSAIKIERKR
jgi:hypothetical protein